MNGAPVTLPIVAVTALPMVGLPVTCRVVGPQPGVLLGMIVPCPVPTRISIGNRPVACRKPPTRNRQGMPADMGKVMEEPTPQASSLQARLLIAPQPQRPKNTSRVVSKFAPQVR